jgi:hypothetical protein
MHNHNRRAVLTALLGSVAGAVVLYKSPTLGFRTPDEQHAHDLRPSLAALGLCDLGQPAKLQRGERSDQHEDSERSDDFKAEHVSLPTVRVLFPQFKIVFRESVDVPGVTKLRIFEAGAATHSVVP